MLILRLMDEANAASVDDFDAGLVQAHDVLLGHKYGTHVRVDISIHLGGRVLSERGTCSALAFI